MVECGCDAGFVEELFDEFFFFGEVGAQGLEDRQTIEHACLPR